jgi:hypothetical protein
MQNNTRAVAACGISYDVARATALAHNGIALDMHDASDVFVNGNFANVEVEHGEMEDMQLEFEQRVEFDECDDDACPVLVYSNESKLVAWFDAERGVGYVAS